MSNGRLMFYEGDDFAVYEIGDVVPKSHIHNLFEFERLELRRCVESCAVERVVE